MPKGDKTPKFLITREKGCIQFFFQRFGRIFTHAFNETTLLANKVCEGGEDEGVHLNFSLKSSAGT